MEYELYEKLSIELCCDCYSIQSWMATPLKQAKNEVTPKLVKQKAIRAGDGEALC